MKNNNKNHYELDMLETEADIFIFNLVNTVRQLEHVATNPPNLTNPTHLLKSCHSKWRREAATLLLDFNPLRAE